MRLADSDSMRAWDCEDCDDAETWRLRGRCTGPMGAVPGARKDDAGRLYVLAHDVAPGLDAQQRCYTCPVAESRQEWVTSVLVQTGRKREPANPTAGWLDAADVVAIEREAVRSERRERDRARHEAESKRKRR